MHGWNSWFIARICKVHGMSMAQEFKKKLTSSTPKDNTNPSTSAGFPRMARCPQQETWPCCSLSQQFTKIMVPVTWAAYQLCWRLLKVMLLWNICLPSIGCLRQTACTWGHPSFPSRSGKTYDWAALGDQANHYAVVWSIKFSQKSTFTSIHSTLGKFLKLQGTSAE